MRTIDDENRIAREETDAILADFLAQCDEYDEKIKTAATAATLTRLATQLELSKPQLRRKLLDLAIREVDWNLSQDCAPFDSCADTEDVDVTAALAALTRHEIADLESEGEYAQRVIYTRAITAQGKRFS
jgi:hypothetical protein